MSQESSDKVEILKKINQKWKDGKIRFEEIL